MSWKFWEKKVEAVAPAGATAEKLPGPKEIPYPVGKHLVVALGQDPDWVWQLKGVVRHREGGGKDAFEVRVFSEGDTAMKKVPVKTYNSLDAHADLILFEGWFDKKSMDVQVEAKTKPRAA
ncbi:MAG: hypothetical protein MUO52_05515 [Desulfobacterales bacterium]|nr:hypothetical protein [Desulfobacterales bacterium]